MRRCFFSILLVCAVLSLALAQHAIAAGEHRTALIIGNGAYKSAPLKNPAKDARDMAALLKSLGFRVTLKTDVGVKEMEEAVRQFGLDLRQGGVGLFYFAGHGVQVQGNNYLVPVDAKIQTESDVRFECVDAGRVLGKMEDANNSLNIVVLDACRNNPFSRSFRSADRGLAEMRAPTGSIIAYATAPGSVASDGTGDNGIYTKHLLKAMRTPGLPITDVFMRVRMGVVGETAKKQVPWESSSLTGYFYLAGENEPAKPASAAAAQPPAPAAPALDIKAEKKRMAEEAERLKREKEELAQLQALQAEKAHMEAERQKIAQAKLLAMASRPKQAPPAAAVKAETAANAPYFSMLARHRVMDAQRYFEEELQTHPENADARAGLAIAYMLTNRSTDAKYHVRRIEESGQTTAGTRLARGFMFAEEGQQADSSYQLNRALEEGADRALVQLAMATAAARKNELDQAKKSMDEYRSLVPPVEENDYAKELAKKVDIRGRLVGTFYWTAPDKSITAYTSTVTFTRAGEGLAGTGGGYDPGQVTNVRFTGRQLRFEWAISGLFYSGTAEVVADLTGDLDTIPVTANWRTSGGNFGGNGFLLRQGSVAQSMAYHASPTDCFIATAAYGEPWDAHVTTLRRFRDSILVRSDIGRELVSAYYHTSPPIAGAIRDRPWARSLVRGALLPVVVLAGAATGDGESIAWTLAAAGTFCAITGLFVLRRGRRRNASGA